MKPLAIASVAFIAAIGLSSAGMAQNTTSGTIPNPASPYGNEAGGSNPNAAPTSTTTTPQHQNRSNTSIDTESNAQGCSRMMADAQNDLNAATNGQKKARAMAEFKMAQQAQRQNDNGMCKVHLQNAMNALG